MPYDYFSIVHVKSTRAVSVQHVPIIRNIGLTFQAWDAWRTLEGGNSNGFSPLNLRPTTGEVAI